MATSQKTMNRCFDHLRQAFEQRSRDELENARSDPKLMAEAFASIMHELGEYDDTAGNLADIISDAGFEWRERLEAEEREEAERQISRAAHHETLSLSQMGLR